MKTHRRLLAGQATDGLEAIRRAFETAGLDDSVKWDSEGFAVGRFHRASLSSVFQPIVELRSRTTVAYEGLVRCYLAEDLAPWGLFSLASDAGNLVVLDRLCRTLHVIDFFLGAGQQFRLHLNVHPRHLQALAGNHGRAFAGLLRSLSLLPQQVVLEFHEAANRDRAALVDAVGNFHSHGFGIALSCGGQDHRWLDQLRAPGGTLVKLVPARLPTCTSLGQAVEACTRNGFSTIVEHIEDDDDLRCALEAGALLGQGLFFGRPARLARAACHA